MIPSVLSNQVQRGVEDFLRTTFPVSSPFFHGVMERFLREDNSIFKGPYISIRLPYRTSSLGSDFFPGITLSFSPYMHQEMAFRRLSGEQPTSTIVATGTGSGKTECFLYPILDYCFRHRGEPGIKAIIIYPMNALAMDQAKRMARLIHYNPNLKNQIKAGLYVGGQQGDNALQVMGRDHLITDRNTLRLKPPDILLTNYKMLDYLLIRPKDFPLWKENGPETLKYLVVDEIHTFDGAQGTDLACLIRRLKNRLKSDKGHLCCVGTSATLGEKETQRICDYAGKVFGEVFTENSVITESLVSADEFLAASSIERSNMVTPEQMDALNPDGYDHNQAYLQAQYALWFGEAIDAASVQWPIVLAENLKKHGFFWKLLLSLNNRIVPLDELIELFDRFTPEFANAPLEYKRRVMDSMIALISAARIIRGNGHAPFLNVRLQLWLRELRRIVGNIVDPPALHFSDDLKEDDQRRHLPIIHCRECGAMGWGGTKREQDHEINPDLQHFYTSFFRYSPTVVVLFPDDTKVAADGQDEFGWIFCGSCLHIAMGKHVKDSCPACGSKEHLISVFIPKLRRQKEKKVIGSHDCPYCQGYNSLTIIGSRAASLTSVVISQIYASTFNKDKKLLTFSDSVQDAAHRAGFFAARTYRFNLRGAIQKFLLEQANELPLTEIPAAFIRFWRERLGDESFITTFLPPDMAWFNDYEILVETGELPAESTLLDDLKKRIAWEILCEYGFNSRIGRTLEKTGSSVAFVQRALLQRAAAELGETLQNEIGILRDLDRDTVLRFLAGILSQMRTKGAFFHPALQTYIEGWGNTYLINQLMPWMPRFGIFTRSPAFITTKRGTRFDVLLSSGRTTPTWYEDWLRKCFGHIHPQLVEYRESVFNLVIKAFMNSGMFGERQVRGFPVWGLNAEHFLVTKQVVQLRCRECSHNVSIAEDEANLWQDTACLRFSCRGQYDREAPVEDYYRHLYANGDVQRLFTAEHTGLLQRDTRESLEKRFMLDNPSPGSPNLLSCTPTLELGIDIGDLSSVILCSVPPAQPNYMQRIGRSGRKNGNSFNFTVANGRPHDLYFYSEPEAMLAGGIEPPGCFLDAPAVLERQMMAFCFDCWIASGISVTAIPDHLGQVLNQLGDHENKKKFPFNLIQYIEHHRSQLLTDFFAMFQDSLGDQSMEHIRGFVYGAADVKHSMIYHIIDRLNNVHKERANLRKRVQKINQLIKDKESNPIRDQNYESMMDELLREKAAANSIIRRMGEKEIYNFFTDEGLLPNYAFPEAGIVLQSIIYKRKTKPDKEGKYQTTTYDYERPAVSAIHELAPDNYFYAEGRKVKVDQVNLNLSEIEEWRFCDKCSHMELAVTGDTTATCPSCGSVLWSDDGQKKRMIRMRQVMATTADYKSRIQDDSDEREPEFFSKQLLLDMAESSVEAAFKVGDDDFPFGMEFVENVTFREMNFGKRDNGGETLMIAGKEFPKNGFPVCRSCGKVQSDEPAHTRDCNKRDGDPTKVISDFLYLYREFSSQALRILLPAKPLSWTDKELHSFTAAFYLGLKKRFEGNIDHLRATIHEEPSLDHQYQKRYLVLYDMVPGGTGYLKELMQTGQPLMDVFQMALDVLKACGCNQDGEKDGCYRCLYAYRNNYERNNTSRDTAIDLLSNILKHRENLVKTDSLKNISINPLLDSKLEEQFIEALRSFTKQDIRISLRQEVVKGKPGWYLKVNERGYFIAPQVDLGHTQGVAVSSRADFIFYPELSRDSKPIVVFTDGFMYHAAKGDKNRIGKDMAKRMAIARSGKYIVWSLSWDDVENSLHKKSGHYDNYLDMQSEKINGLHARYDAQFKVKILGTVRYQSGFEMLITYLADPDSNMWSMYALIHGLVNLDCICKDEDAHSIMRGLWKDGAWREIQLNLLSPDKLGNCLAGLYQRSSEDNPLIKLLTHINKDDYSENHFDNMSVICRLFDDDDLVDQASYKAAWNGFIRMYNVYQFIPDAVFITTRGIAEGQYNWIMAETKTEKEHVAVDSEIFSTLRGLTDTYIHPFLSFLVEHGMPLPEAGFELCDEKDQVLASAELGWPDQKIAFLREDEIEFAGIFAAAGWRWKSLSEIVAEPSIFITLFK